MVDILMLIVVVVAISLAAVAVVGLAALLMLWALSGYDGGDEDWLYSEERDSLDGSVD